MRPRKRRPKRIEPEALLLPVGSEKPYDLRERTRVLAVRALQPTAALPATPEGLVVRQQLARAGTSVGANVEEADGALTTPDKRKSFVVARKEAGELRFWLRVIELNADLQESTEIILILSAIIARLS